MSESLFGCEYIELVSELPHRADQLYISLPAYPVTVGSIRVCDRMFAKNKTVKEGETMRYFSTYSNLTLMIRSSFCRRTSLTKHQESNHASILIESSSKSGILDGLCASDSQILEATSIADDTWSLLEQSHLSSPTSNYMFGWEHHMSTSILPAHENMQELSMQRNLLMQQQQSHSISNQHQLFRLLEYYT